MSRPDPVVSPADTRPHSDAELAQPELLSDERLAEIVAQCLRKLDALPTVPGTLRLYRNGVTALTQLRLRLAVGERDKAEIERLTAESERWERRAWNAEGRSLKAGERDRRQIAQLTEALIFWVRRARDFEAEVPERKAYLRAKGVTSVAYETGRRTFEESLPTVDDVQGILRGAVLAGEEDAP